MTMRRILPTVLMLLCLVPTLCAGENSPAQAYYQQGLDAYLQGDYDQAILFTAKSLQTDPGFKKSQDLLSILVVEKEQGTQTEIWLSQKRREIGVAGPADGHDEIWAEIQKIQGQIGHLANAAQMKALERRMTSLVRLMEKTANGNYEEIQASQARALEKMEVVAGRQAGQGRSLFWLFVLVGFSVFLSLWALLRKKDAPPRQLVAEDKPAVGSVPTD
jgi:hypothetical protein